MNAQITTRKVVDRVKWIIENCYWTLFRLVYKWDLANSETSSFTIGVTTFMDRYDTCLKPLIRKLSVLFPECQILVLANGHVKEKEQKLYLSKLESFCKGFENIKLISFSDPVGLSVLWNIIIEKSESEKVLILNDDLILMKGFREFIGTSGILNSSIASINTSWSHFFISKSIVEQIGGFDENLKEIGGEDDDYAARLAIAGIPIVGYNTKTIIYKLRSRDKKLTMNSYGKNMFCERGGYSTLNTEYLEKKWLMSDQYIEGAVFVPNRKPKFWKLRSNIE